MNKRPTRLYGIAGILLLLTISCASNKHTVVSSNHTNTHPKFINNVAIDGKSNTINMDNVVSRHHHNKSTKNTSTNNSVATNKGQKYKNNKELSPLIAKYAQMIGIAPDDIDNIALYAFIDEWYGVPYTMGGNDKTGIDCSAFVQKLYDQVFGTNLLRTAMTQFENCETIRNIKKMKEGDLVFFHIHSRHITHVGVYLANQYFVHASSSQGVVISSLNEEYWHKYYAGGGFIPHNNSHM